MSNNDNSNISKSNIKFNNLASGIKFNYKGNNKNMLNRKNFTLTEEYSCDIIIDEKPENNFKKSNEINFKPSTKQTIDKNEFKRFKKRFNMEEEDEIKEEKEDEEKNSKNSGIQTPPSRLRNNIYFYFFLSNY